MPDRPAAALDAVRTDLARTLPDHLAAAVESYRLYAAGPAPDDAKGFAAHHAACKAALAHAEALTKLLRWTRDEAGEGAGTDGDGLEDDAADRLIEAARQALADLADDPLQEGP